MADPQQNYRNVLSRLEAKDKKGTSAQDLYDAASFLPGTGEAIAAYELPGILSQGGQMMQSDDVLEALKGMGLVTLGTASVAPGIGPVARKARALKKVLKVLFRTWDQNRLSYGCIM